MDDKPATEFDFKLMTNDNNNSVKTDEEKMKEENETVWKLEDGNMVTSEESVEDEESKLSEDQETESLQFNEESPASIDIQSLEIPNYDEHMSDFETEAIYTSLLNAESNDTLNHDFLENSKNIVSRKIRPSTTQHIDLPEDIKELGDLYVRLYTKHPSLKNDIIKMYQLDEVLEQKNQEYFELCKKSSSDKINENKPVPPKNKPMKSECTRKVRIYTAYHPSALKKRISVPANERKIKSAAINNSQISKNEHAEDTTSEEVEISETEMTEEEIIRIERLLEEEVKDSNSGYTPDKETEKLLQDINDKLKIFTPETDMQCDVEKVSNVQENIQEPKNEKTSLKIDLQEWGCGLENKLHLRDIDKKLKVLKQKEESNLSELEIQKLIEDSTKSLNRNANKQHLDTENDTILSNSSSDNLSSRKWTLSKETLQNLLSEVYQSYDSRAHDDDDDKHSEVDLHQSM